MDADPDLLFAIGVVCALMAFPALLSAFSSSRSPRMAALLILVASLSIATASFQKPSGYTISQAPQIVFDVVGRYLN